MSQFQSAPKNKLVYRLQDKFYTGFRSPRSDFRTEILKRVSITSIVLDYGAGRGRNKLVDFKSIVAKVHGVDVDEAVFENPLLHEARLINENIIPYGENFFDIVYSIYVLEHIGKPLSMFKEIWRVLKPGGYFIALTPGSHHYVSLIAKATPHSFHEWIVEKTENRKANDTFPTFYRANSEHKITSLAKEANFLIEKILMKENLPVRLSFNPIAFLIGVVYERVVNTFHRLRHFRGNILIILKKPL